MVKDRESGDWIWTWLRFIKMNGDIGTSPGFPGTNFPLPHSNSFLLFLNIVYDVSLVGQQQQTLNSLAIWKDNIACMVTPGPCVIVFYGIYLYILARLGISSTKIMLPTTITEILKIVGRWLFAGGKCLAFLDQVSTCQLNNPAGKLVSMQLQ